MNSKYKRIYCCTPVSFHANEHFFIRDTGLISTVLRDMGVESKCIMPLPFHDDDQREHIIRTEFANLESSEWWKSLQIDALVLYSWGAPRYRKIARAIHRAGIRLHIHMDTSGNFEGPALKSLPLVKRILRRLKVKAQDVLRDTPTSSPLARQPCKPSAKDFFTVSGLQKRDSPWPRRFHRPAATMVAQRSLLFYSSGAGGI